MSLLCLNKILMTGTYDYVKQITDKQLSLYDSLEIATMIRILHELVHTVMII